MKRYRSMKPCTLGCLLAALAAALALPAFGAAPAAPTISGYAATDPRGVPIFSAPPGAPMLIEGANFGSTSGTIAFGGIPAPQAVSWSPTEILAIVPTAPSYPFKGPVTVTANGQTASGPEFTITPPPVEPWSVISLPQKPGEVTSATALASDADGNLYLADGLNGTARLQKRDAQGNWSVIATHGTGLGQVGGAGTFGGAAVNALAADGVGNIYMAEIYNDRIQKRDAQGNWSLVARPGANAIAVDTAGSLYAAGDGIGIQKLQGNSWSQIAGTGDDLGQVDGPSALAVDTTGNLYVADSANGGRIQKRDTQGRWSEIDDGQVSNVGALAVDAAGSLYVTERFPSGGIQKRDAQGNWTVITTQWASALAVDRAGSLYVADAGSDGRVRKRDTQGNWSVLADTGAAPGQVLSPSAIAAGAAGSLYVGDGGTPPITLNFPANYQGDKIHQRDAQGNWSVIATYGTALGQIVIARALASDAAGNLYVADLGNGIGRIQKRDAGGNWSMIAASGDDLGQVDQPMALAMDTTGGLYVADATRIQKRDAHGNWSVIATVGTASGQVPNPSALAVDAAGDLYVAGSDIRQRDARGNWSVIVAQGASALAVDAAGNLYAVGGPDPNGAIQKRDALGHWSVIATSGTALGQVYGFPALAVDTAGDLYVADNWNSRVQEYTPGGGP